MQHLFCAFFKENLIAEVKKVLHLVFYENCAIDMHYDRHTYVTFLEKMIVQIESMSEEEFIKYEDRAQNLLMDLTKTVGAKVKDTNEKRDIQCQDEEMKSPAKIDSDQTLENMADHLNSNTVTTAVAEIHELADMQGDIGCTNPRELIEVTQTLK